MTSPLKRSPSAVQALKSLVTADFHGPLVRTHPAEPQLKEAAAKWAAGDARERRESPPRPNIPLEPIKARADIEGVSPDKVFSPPRAIETSDPESIAIAEESADVYNLTDARRELQRAAARNAAIRKLNDARKQLSRKPAEALEAYLQTGSFVRAAEHVGVAESTVRARVSAGLDLLRQSNKLPKDWRQLFPLDLFGSPHNAESCHWSDRDQVDTSYTEKAAFDNQTWLSGARSLAHEKLSYVAAEPAVSTRGLSQKKLWAANRRRNKVGERYRNPTRAQRVLMDAAKATHELHESIGFGEVGLDAILPTGSTPADRLRILREYYQPQIAAYVEQRKVQDKSLGSLKKQVAQIERQLLTACTAERARLNSRLEAVYVRLEQFETGRIYLNEHCETEVHGPTLREYPEWLRGQGELQKWRAESAQLSDVLAWEAAGISSTAVAVSTLAS